jgi:hypothetical protein
MMAGIILPLNFRGQEHNQNTPTPGNYPTMPAHEMFPVFFLNLNNLPVVADVHTLIGQLLAVTEDKD